MADTQMTQRDFYNEIIALANDNDRDDIVDFCNGRIAQLDKKKAGGSGVRKSAVTDENKELIVGILATIGSGTCTDIINNGASGFSTQKIRPILTALVSDGKVTNEKVKGKSIYSLA